MLSTEAGERTQGVVQGFASSSGAVASITGLLVGGVLYESLTEQIFLVAASITVVAALGSLRIRARRASAADAAPAALRARRRGSGGGR